MASYDLFKSSFQQENNQKMRTGQGDLESSIDDLEDFLKKVGADKKQRKAVIDGMRQGAKTSNIFGTVFAGRSDTSKLRQDQKVIGNAVQFEEAMKALKNGKP
jgi:hypothetical protein